MTKNPEISVEQDKEFSSPKVGAEVAFMAAALTGNPDNLPESVRRLDEESRARLLQAFYYLCQPVHRVGGNIPDREVTH